MTYYDTTKMNWLSPLPNIPWPQKSSGPFDALEKFQKLMDDAQKKKEALENKKKAKKAKTEKKKRKPRKKKIEAPILHDDSLYEREV